MYRVANGVDQDHTDHMILVLQLLTLSVSISRIVVVINFVYERLCMWFKLVKGYIFFLSFS